MERRRRPSGESYGYALSAFRALLAACLLYVFVQLIYALARLVSIYGGLVIAGGTGILLGLVMEFLRRRRI